MTRFIGIDYSTTACGIAIVDGARGHWQTLTLRSKPLGTTLPHYYARILTLAADIAAVIDVVPGDVIAVEGLAFAGRGASVDRLHYAWHRTVEYLSRLLADDEVRIVTTNQVKQLATGRGNSQKDEVLLATERRIPQAQASNNDEADAVWIAVGASILAGQPVIELPAAHFPKAFARPTNHRPANGRTGTIGDSVAGTKG